VNRRWRAEKLSGLTSMVHYVHTKYLLVDPLGKAPLVVSGSANFSEDSTTNNDENMLVIPGERRVADIYLGEFMRLWNHWYARDIAGRYKAKAESEERKSAYLAPDDSWTKRYYEDGDVRCKERMLFAAVDKAGRPVH